MLTVLGIEFVTLCITLCYSDSRDVMNGHRQKILAVKMHPSDPHTVVSGGWDDTVQV